jgi:hypothetical protein
VVLDTVAEEDLSATVVHGDRDDALGPLAAFTDAVVEFQEVGNTVELSCGHAEDRVIEKLLFHVGVNVGRDR